MKIWQTRLWGPLEITLKVFAPFLLAKKGGNGRKGEGPLGNGVRGPQIFEQKSLTKELALFFWRSTIENNMQTASTLKEPSTTMSSSMDLTPNKHQQPFIYIAKNSLNAYLYKFQHELGGMVIEGVDRFQISRD